MRIDRMLCLLMILLLACAPASAEVVGETALSFPLDAEREHITLYSVELTRTPQMLSLDVIYAIPEGLSQAERESLELISFYVKEDPVDIAFTGDFHGGYTQPIDPASVDSSLPAGECFLDHSEFAPLDAFPDKLYLRPYYKNLGEWGAAVELDFTQAVIVPIEAEADLPTPESLTEGSNG